MGWHVVGRFPFFGCAHLHLFDAAVLISRIDEEAKEEGDRRPKSQR